MEHRLQQSIRTLIGVRQRNGIHCRSEVRCWWQLDLWTHLAGCGDTVIAGLWLPVSSVWVMWLCVIHMFVCSLSLEEELSQRLSAKGLSAPDRAADMYKWMLPAHCRSGSSMQSAASTWRRLMDVCL